MNGAPRAMWSCLHTHKPRRLAAHRNAPLTPNGRLRLCRIEDGWTWPRPPVLSDLAPDHPRLVVAQGGAPGRGVAPAPPAERPPADRAKVPAFFRIHRRPDKR